MKKTALSSTISEDVAVSLVAATAVLDVGVVGEIYMYLYILNHILRSIYICMSIRIWIYICINVYMYMYV
jgi:hypothetical protein